MNRRTSHQMRRHPMPNNSQQLGINEPTKYDEMVTDILKHLTTLNTGLLAIIAAFNQEIVPIFQQNISYATTYFVGSFYTSLVFCVFGFVVTVLALRKKNIRFSGFFGRARDITVVCAAVSYMVALIFLFDLLTSAYQLSL